MLSFLPSSRGEGGEVGQGPAFGVCYGLLWATCGQGGANPEVLNDDSCVVGLRRLVVRYWKKEVVHKNALFNDTECLVRNMDILQKFCTN